MDIHGTEFEGRFAELILSYAAEARLELTFNQARLLSRHIRIMLEWNSRFNLTRITDPKEVIIKHLLDSIVPAKYLPTSGHALDVGAGAGFPGIPLKIVHPDLQMLLLESSGKKASFLNAAASSLEMPGLTALHESWQDFRRRKENAGSFQLIVIRAVKAEPGHISRLASSLLAPGGVFARWDSLDPDAGPQSQKQRLDVEFYGDFDYSLPGMNRPRVVRLWKKSQ